MMMKYCIKALKAEWLKTKGLGIKLTAFGLGILIPLIYFLVVTFNDDVLTLQDDHNEVASLFFMDTFNPFAQFFLMIFIIIAASRIAQVDHRNNGWNFIETQPLSKFSIYMAKFFSVLMLSILCITAYFATIIILGHMNLSINPDERLNFKINFSLFLSNYLRLIILSAGIISLQLFLSITLRGFIWPMLIGFSGIIGNTILIAKSLKYDFIPYHNVIASLSRRNTEDFHQFFNYSDGLSLFWTILFILIGYNIYRHKGIRNSFYKNTKKITQSLIGLVLILGAYQWITFPKKAKRIDGKTVIEGSINSTFEPKEMSLYTADQIYEIAKIPIENGQFKWETNEAIPLGEYYLILNGRYINLILSSGDYYKLTINETLNSLSAHKNGSRNAEMDFKMMRPYIQHGVYQVGKNIESYLNNPDKFYAQIKKDWDKNLKKIRDFRSFDNEYPGKDFQLYLYQIEAIGVKTIINNFLKYTSATGSNLTPPEELTKELDDILKAPTEMTMANDDYIEWKTQSFLPLEGIANPDSVILAKITLLENGREKDRLLVSELKKNFKLLAEESQRNELFEAYKDNISDVKFLRFIEKTLARINNEQKGKPFPKLDLENINGEQLDLSIYKGKYVLIDFWASWCKPCKTTTPQFEYQANQYKYYKEELVFIAISVDEKINDWKQNVQNNKSEVAQYWGGRSEALNSIYFESIPRFVLLDKEGNIYNADMPRPGETSFKDIVRQVLKIRY